MNNGRIIIVLLFWCKIIAIAGGKIVAAKLETYIIITIFSFESIVAVLFITLYYYSL